MKKVAELAKGDSAVIYGVASGLKPMKAFRKKILAGQPDSASEQDYFDWELAVTGITDMQAEIKRLKALSKKA